MRKKQQSLKKSFPIVGIGASAGGLEAFRMLLEELPTRTGMAFVLVQHLDPTHESQLTELLSRATKMPVVEVRHRMQAKPDHVYVIPPDKYMAFARGLFKLTPRDERGEPNMPVNIFLESLATECGKACIGVILSGTATDGSEGVRAIRASGGITFAQDEGSAKYSGMPRAAAETGCVDFVASPQAIAKELARISRHPYIHHTPQDPGAEESENGDDLSQIFRVLRSATGVDFTQYKPNTIRRRIERRMALHRIQKLEQYRKFLADHPKEAETLYEDLLINVTGFFRDAKSFHVLKEKILPRLIDQRRGEESIRVWVPGCSTGEEAYSLAIILLEYLGDKASQVSIQAFATDISERALQVARQGMYPASIRKAMSAGRLRRFFTKVPTGYQINKSVRELCIFAKQNVAKDPPFSNLDLISCRNVLIYLSPILQRRVLPVFHYALKPNGFLLLGNSETVGGFEKLFAPVDVKHRIYTKRAGVTRATFDFALTDYPANEKEVPRKAATTGAQGFDAPREADRILLGRFAPASVLINEDMEIVQFRGHTGLFLEPAVGAASLNLLKMAREGLFMELRGAIARARRQGVAIRREGLRVKSNGGFFGVNFEVVPIKSNNRRERHFLVLFEESKPPAPPEKTATRARPPKVEKLEKTTVRLEQELTATKEYMQSVVEELEDANEELKAANEEIQSSNEELQSTNEELETAKEELQSTNEELTTVNEELQNRNAELLQLSNDWMNVLSSVNLPILIFSADLRLRRMTMAAQKVLNVLPTDIGRSVADLRLPLDVPDLEKLIAEAIDSLSPRECEVQDRAGCWYQLRVRPYRTAENKIEGAVVKLLDIDALKRSLQKAEEARDFTEAIVETVREPLLVLDGKLRVLVANRSFLRVFHVKAEETTGRFVYQLGDRQWDIPLLRTILEEILPKNSHLDDFEVDHVFPKIGRRIMLLNARRLKREGLEASMILLAIEDITERRRLEKAVLDISEEEQQRIGRDLHDSLGQQLAGIGFMVDSLEKDIASRALPRARALVAKINERLRDATTQTRDLAKGLFPVELRTHGIAVALQKLALNTQNLFNINCRFKGDSGAQIRDESLARNLYRIAMEAVSNAAKHSHGKHITILLGTQNGPIKLVVKDDGVGFRPDRQRETDMGLHIMAYRANMIGAKLEIGSGPHGGAVITCTVEKSRTKKEA